jgi:competence protein ComEA
MLKKLSRKIGFTETESKIVLFLISALFVGIFLNFIKESKNDKNLLQFDYRVSDSIFNNGAAALESADTLEKIIEKYVDSKRELLDFNGAKFAENNLNNSGFNGKKIEINGASAKDLISLPGIGPKTADAIVNYRIKYGRFKVVEDLLNVRGIGKSKFEKIRKHIFVQ